MANLEPTKVVHYVALKYEYGTRVLASGYDFEAVRERARVEYEYILASLQQTIARLEDDFPDVARGVNEKLEHTRAGRFVYRTVTTYDSGWREQP